MGDKAAFDDITSAFGSAFEASKRKAKERADAAAAARAAAEKEKQQKELQQRLRQMPMRPSAVSHGPSPGPVPLPGGYPNPPWGVPPLDGAAGHGPPGAPNNFGSGPPMPSSQYYGGQPMNAPGQAGPHPESGYRAGYPPGQMPGQLLPPYQPGHASGLHLPYDPSHPPGPMAGHGPDYVPGQAHPPWDPSHSNVPPPAHQQDGSNPGHAATAGFPAPIQGPYGYPPPGYLPPGHAGYPGYPGYMQQPPYPGVLPPTGHAPWQAVPPGSSTGLVANPASAGTAALGAATPTAATAASSVEDAEFEDFHGAEATGPAPPRAATTGPPATLGLVTAGQLMGAMQGAGAGPQAGPGGVTPGFGAPSPWPYAPQGTPGQPLQGPGGVAHAPWQTPGQDGHTFYPPPHAPMAQAPWAHGPPSAMPAGAATFGGHGEVAPHTGKVTSVAPRVATYSGGGDDDGFGDFADASAGTGPAPAPAAPTQHQAAAAPPMLAAQLGHGFGQPAGGFPPHAAQDFPHAGPLPPTSAPQGFSHFLPSWEASHGGPAPVAPVASGGASAAATDDADFGDFATVDAAPTATQATSGPLHGFMSHPAQPGAVGLADSSFGWSVGTPRDASKDALHGGAPNLRTSLDAGASSRPSFEASFPAGFAAGLHAPTAHASPASAPAPLPVWSQVGAGGVLPELSLDDFSDAAPVVPEAPSMQATGGPAGATAAAASGAGPGGAGGAAAGATELDFGDFAEAEATPAAATATPDASTSMPSFAAFSIGSMPLGAAFQPGPPSSEFDFGAFNDASSAGTIAKSTATSFGMPAPTPFEVPTAPFGVLGGSSFGVPSLGVSSFETGRAHPAPTQLSDNDFGEFAEVPPPSASAVTTASGALAPGGISSELDFGDFAEADTGMAAPPPSGLHGDAAVPVAAVAGDGFGSASLWTSAPGDTSFGEFAEASGGNAGVVAGVAASAVSASGASARAAASSEDDFGDFSQAEGALSAMGQPPAPLGAFSVPDEGASSTTHVRQVLSELDFGDFADAGNEASTATTAPGGDADAAAAPAFSTLAGGSDRSSAFEFGDFEGNESLGGQPASSATATVAGSVVAPSGEGVGFGFGDEGNGGGAFSDSEFGSFSETTPPSAGVPLGGAEATSTASSTTMAAHGEPTPSGTLFGSFPHAGGAFDGNNLGHAGGDTSNSFAPSFAALPPQPGTSGSTNAFASSDAFAGRKSFDEAGGGSWGAGDAGAAEGAGGGMDDSFGEFCGPGSPGYKGADASNGVGFGGASAAPQGAASQADVAGMQPAVSDQQGGDDWDFQGGEPAPAAAEPPLVAAGAEPPVYMNVVAGGADDGFGDFSSGTNGWGLPVQAESAPYTANSAARLYGSAGQGVHTSAALGAHGAGSLSAAEKKRVLLQLMDASQAAACAQGLYSLERRAFACAVQSLMMGPRPHADASSTDGASRTASRRLSLLLGVEQQAHADAGNRAPRASQDGGEGCSLLALLKHGQVEGMAVSAYALSCRQCGVVLLMAGATDGGRVCLACGQPQGSLPAGVAGRWQWSACQRRWVASLGLHRARVPVVDARAGDAYGVPVASGALPAHRGPGHAPSVEDLVDDLPQGSDSAMDKWLESLEHGPAHSSKAAAASVARASPAKGGPTPVRTRSEEGSVGGSAVRASGLSSGATSVVVSPLAVPLGGGGAPIDLMDMGAGGAGASSAAPLDRVPRSFASSGDLLDLLGGASSGAEDSSVGGGLPSSRSSLSLSVSSPHVGVRMGVAAAVDAALLVRNIDTGEMVDAAAAVKPLSTPTFRVAASGGSFTGGHFAMAGGRATDDKLVVAAKQQSFTSLAFGTPATHGHSHSVGSFPTDLLSLYDATPQPHS